MADELEAIRQQIAAEAEADALQLREIREFTASLDPTPAPPQQQQAAPTDSDNN